MTSKIYNLINSIFAIWICFILFGAIRSDNLLIDGLSKLSTLVILVSIIILYEIFKKKNILVKVANFISLYKKQIVIILIAITIIYQMAMVIAIHLPISFDVFFIWGYLNNPANGWTEYFSFYPNNLFLLFFLKGLTNIFHMTPSWGHLDIINLFMVDLSAILNILIVKTICSKKVNIGIVVNCIWLLFFPQILVPYTDTMVLPFISIYIYLLIYLYTKYDKSKTTLIFLLFSIFVSLAYLMKPTAIIPVIAGVLLVLLKAKKLKITILIKGIMVCLITFLVITTGFKSYTLHQDFIKIDYSKKMPAIHYINMGLHDETKGGYNNDIAIQIRMKPTQKDKINYSIDGIKHQLKQKGLFGEIKSLINKNFYNTEDGTFGWNSEGNGYFSVWNKDHFERVKLSNNKYQRFFENIYHIDGKYAQDYKFWSQLVWIIVLLLMLISTKNKKDFFNIFCKLSLIGGFLFLLIFEGGRSRYLIQFLPVILLLCTLTIDNCRTYLKK